MNPRVKLSAAILLFFLIVGTLFYMEFEKWSVTDSFYFTTITLTTIGYGDIHPTTNFTKIATAFFAITGVSIVVYSLSMIGADFVQSREEEMMRRVEQATSGKGESPEINLLRADKHIIELLKQIDARIKK